MIDPTKSRQHAFLKTASLWLLCRIFPRENTRGTYGNFDSWVSSTVGELDCAAELWLISHGS